MSNNLAVLFAGWTSVGVCTYLLCGATFESEREAAASKKTLIISCIGDFGMLAAMALMLRVTGGLSWVSIDANTSRLISDMQLWPIGEMHQWLPRVLAGPIRVSHATIIGGFLLVSCASKSALFPLHAWLSKSTSASPPTSAILQSATTGAAGLFLLTRLSNVFVFSPRLMMIVAAVGAATALVGAMACISEKDVRKSLALITISQLGFMFMGAGVGAFDFAVAQLVTHASCIACMVLGAAFINTQNRARTPRLHRRIATVSLAIAAAGIIGIPPAGGFFSSQGILARTLTNRVHPSNILVEGTLQREARAAGGELSNEASQAIIDSLSIPGWFYSALFVIGLIVVALTALNTTRVISSMLVERSPENQLNRVDKLDRSQPSLGRKSTWQHWLPIAALAAVVLGVGWTNASVLGI
ncbi:MAG: hypothetical protein FWD57_09435, partial [Polyangiaceae bacterium]|nr:hypothetical protein [Polyangiaceae bacterium]